MTEERFFDKLRELGVPEHLIGGFAQNGPARAFFSDRSEVAILACLTADDPEGQRPGPYFDPAYYGQQNPDWDGKEHPLIHYLGYWYDGDERPAHPLFDAEFYARTYPDLVEAGAASLLHFAQYGDQELRVPSLGFDPRFYAKAYLPLEATRPFQHFIRHGQAQGLHPKPPKRRPRELATWVTELCEQCVKPIILISHDARYGGAPNVLLQISAELRRRDWDPIFLLREGGTFTPRFHRCGPTFNLLEGWDLTDLGALPTDVPVLASTVVSAPVLNHFDPGHLRLLIVQEMGKYAREAGFLEALGQAARTGATLLFSHPPVLESYNGLLPADIPPERFRVERQSLRLQHVGCGQRFLRIREKLRRRGTQIIGAGYADHRKGFDLFIEVSRELYRTDANMHFVWLGELGAWAQEIANNAIEQGLPLTLPGFVTDSPAWFAASDLFLLTTRQDPGPSVLVESIFQGTPFVGFDTDLGIRDLIAPHGTLVKAGDISAAAAATVKALAQETDATRRRRRLDAQKENSFPTYVNRLEYLLCRHDR